MARVRPERPDWLLALRRRSPDRWSYTSTTSLAQISADGNEIGSFVRYWSRCLPGDQADTSVGTSSRTWALNGAPSRPGFRWSSRGFLLPTYGWGFRGTSQSGLRCRTRSG